MGQRPEVPSIAPAPRRPSGGKGYCSSAAGGSAQKEEKPPDQVFKTWEMEM